MKTLHRRCAGVDVHKKEVVACLRARIARSKRRLILLDAKRRFGLGELDVGRPQLFVAPVSDVSRTTWSCQPPATVKSDCAASRSPMRQRIGYRLAFKVGARHVVKQHLVLDCKKLA